MIFPGGPVRDKFIGRRCTLNATASFNFDREYYRSFYANWLAYRSRWRRFAIPVATAVLIVSGAAFWFSTTHRQIAGGFFTAAFIVLADSATYRIRWVRKRLASVAVDKSADFTFADDHVQVSTPNSESTLKYDVFGSVTLTPDGIFLVPDSGVAIFVPRTAFSTDDAFSCVSAKLSQHMARRCNEPADHRV